MTSGWSIERKSEVFSFSDSCVDRAVGHDSAPSLALNHFPGNGFLAGGLELRQGLASNLKFGDIFNGHYRSH